MRFVSGLMRYRRRVLIVMAGVTLWAGISMSAIRFDQDNESLQATGTPAAREAQVVRDKFGSGATVMVGWDVSTLPAEDRLALLQAMAEELQSLARVKAVGPLSMTSEPVLQDMKTGGFWVRLTDDHPKGAPAREALQAIQSVLGPYHHRGVRTALAGLPVIQQEVARLAEEDHHRVVAAIFLTFVMLLGLMFRQISGVLIPLIITGVSLVWTLGLYAAVGLALNPITLLISPVVIVVSVATGMHLYCAYRSSKGASHIQRLEEVWQRCGVPCLLSVVTTMGGLGSLMLSPVPAVQQFGAFACLGICLSWIVAMVLFPVISTMIRPRVMESEMWGYGWVERMYVGSIRRPKRVLALVMAGVIGLGIYGLNVSLDTNIMQYISADPRWSATPKPYRHGRVLKTLSKWWWPFITVFWMSGWTWTDSTKRCAASVRRREWWV